MAAKKTKRATGTVVSKSAFVRDLPASMPAKEVSARAKAAGLTISDRYVHVIRSIAKRSSQGGAKVAVPKTVSRGGRPISPKRAFVLSLPGAVPVAEVIKQAKAQGMKLSTNYVYKIRSRGAVSTSSAKVVAVAAPKARRAGRPAKPPAAAPSAEGTHEERFLSIVLDVGLSRAAAMLEKVRARVKDLAL